MKKALKIVLPLLVLLLGLPALLPSEFQVQRSIKIENTQEDVYAYLVNLQSWAEWNPWLSEAPDAKVRFHGIPGVVGSYYEWEGIKVGAGRQTLTQVKEPDTMEFALEFKQPEGPPAQSFMEITPSGSGVTVTWGMKGALAFPLGRLMGLFFPKWMGEKFDEGLKNLKEVLEKSSQEPAEVK